MTTTYKILAQRNPSANTSTHAYTVPTANSAVISTIAVCNLGNVSSYRLAISPGNVTVANSHYIAYNATIASADSQFITIGVSIAAGDAVYVYANTASLTFSVFGAEIY